MYAPYVGSVGEARDFVMSFSYPDAVSPQSVAWRVELLGADGMPQRVWYGEERFSGKPFAAKVAWDGLGRAKARMADGHYTVRMTAAVGDPVALRTTKGTRADRVEEVLGRMGDEVIVQEWPIQVGRPEQPQMPEFQALPTTTTMQNKSGPATGSLPYTVYYGNLHSQTSHSDGGGALSSCSGAQPPQTGTAGGPTEAFAYAKARGLDILVASEHNHMFDGSDSTSTVNNQAYARNLYASGLSLEQSFNAANPNFLGVYGMEWGVISNGGHLNIFNSNELFSWELDPSGQLFGDVQTTKNDYPALYTTMKNKGLVGQFNHPSSSGQFQALSGSVPFVYSADGDAVMVLSEIRNSPAFSTSTTESDALGSGWESSFNIILERGFHVAPSSDQDNHCANWGASATNRTGILIPNGTALSKAAFIDALKARRVFATMDKNSQLILTANGHVMGERFANSGALTLTANFANSNGRTASTVSILEGVPGRNGTVTQLSSTAVTTITPANGEHFYYAKVTQDDGKILWSAPVWVTQGASTDNVPPTVSASETGTSGTITLSASASDNVGVTNVEFYVDGVLKGSDNTSPYSITLDSTTLTNGSHALTAKAYDAAGNSTLSTATNFTVSNTDSIPPTVSAAEAGTSGTITFTANASDNVGVSKVEFYVDTVLKGTDTTSPFSMTLDSTTLSNGSHSLTARAYDAGGNSTLSTAVSFTVSNATSAFSETESNGTVATANTVARTFTSIVGTMGNTTDKDYFKLSLNANEKLTINMTGPASTDYDLYLVNGSDATLVSSTASGSTESITYTNGASAQTVYAKVISFSGSSTTLTYNLALSYVAGGSTATELLLNPGFESGNVNWTASSGVIDNSTGQASRTGSWKAWMNGYGSAHTDTLYQQVNLKSSATVATFSFWLKVVSDETTTTTAFDTLKVQVLNSTGTVLATLATYSNLDKGSSYVQKSFDLSAYKGQSIRVNFVGTEGSTTATSFLIDDASVTIQ